MAAARWITAQRLLEEGADNAKAFEACAACNPKGLGPLAEGVGCGECGGLGFIDRRKADPPGEEMAEFFWHFGIVRRRGWTDWIAIHGQPDPWFVEAVEYLELFCDARD